MGRKPKLDIKPKEKVSIEDINFEECSDIIMCSYRDCPILGCKRFHLNREYNVMYLVEDYKPNKDDNICKYYL